MSTWKSYDSIKYRQDMGDAWSDSKKTWEYQTTADILTVITFNKAHYGYYSQGDKESRECYDRTEAIALLKSLIDWVETYEGTGTVEQLLKSRIKRIEER